jgi:hypothetical protein
LPLDGNGFPRPTIADEQTKAIIAGSLRTLVQFAPVVGGAVAQAWSEFEGIQPNARIDEFFAEFRTRLEALEADAPVTPSLRVGGHQTL